MRNRSYTPFANGVGRIHVSLCPLINIRLEQSYSFVYGTDNWAFRISQSWRIDGDIKPFWSSIASIIYQQSINYLSTGHYAHNDMDMLEVGNNGQGTPVGNLTIAEQRSHFTAWALLKSPLLIGTDLRNATRETIEILGNKEIIDINQDPHEGAALAPFRIGLQPDYQWLEYNASYPYAFLSESEIFQSWC